MTNRNNILFYILATIVLLTGLSSCLSKDEVTPSMDVSGDIEFVARPTSYNGHVVANKATSVDDFEYRVHNCYLLLFNAAGNRVFLSEDLAGLTTYRISKSEIISKLGSTATCTACFIANVPVDVIEGLTTLTAVNSAVLDINYSNADVQDTNNNNKHSAFVVPEFDLDGNANTDAVQCLPMYGEATCNLGTADLFEITMKRLFAKVSVNIALGSTLGQLSANFELIATHLTNLPTKVRIKESTGECAWVTEAASFMQNQIEGPINEQVSVSSPYEFYFYVPEYYLTPLTESQYQGPSGTYDNEKYKPKKYDTSKNPIVVKLFGKYDDSILSSQRDVAYTLYLGENASNSFTLKRNTHYRNTVSIHGLNDSMTEEGDGLDWRVDVSPLDEVQVLGQTANCYVIGEAGTYIYPACKGVWTEGLSNIPESMMCSRTDTQIEIIAQDSESISLTNLTYNRESKEFSFDVSSINDGNVVVGLTYMENGVKKIEWSWHLWFVTGVNLGTALEGFFDVQSQTMPNGFEMMDRNIGANINVSELDFIPGMVQGIYYKYGYRTPYFKHNGEYAYYGSNKNSSDDYFAEWNSEIKSITDPCPPGYRIPTSSVWEALEGGTQPISRHASIPLLGDAYEYWEGIYYPYSGYVDNNGVIQSQGYDSPIITEGFKKDVPANQKDRDATVYATYTTPLKFTNVTYSEYNIDNLGFLMAQDKQLRYAYTEKGIDINSCTLQIGSWKGTGGFLGIGTKYNPEYKNPPLTLTGEQLKTTDYYWYYLCLLSVITGGDGRNDQVIGDILKDIFSSPSPQANIQDIQSDNYGYQVRCVRE